MRAWLTLALSLLAVGCECGDDCAGIACDACPPAIQIDVMAPEASDAPTVTGDVDLTCDPRPGGFVCHAVSAPVGSYTFEVALGGEMRTVTIELREGGEGCCSCPTVSAVGQVDFPGASGDGGAGDAGAGADGGRDGGGPDGGAPDGGRDEDAGRSDGGAGCDPSVVEFPMGGALEPGNLCDDVFACVPASAVASVEASTVFDCTGVSAFSCAAGERACRYADPGGPSTLDEAEIANVCALTVHAPPPSRVVCRIYL